MKQFEVQSPSLKRALGAFEHVIEGRKDGVMETSEARDIVAAANGVVRTVGQELKVRLAMPKIAAMEARQIEQSARKQDRLAGTEAERESA